MTTIGVIGASGQVGTEVCLFLKTYSGVRPVAVVRTPISGAFLRRLDVEVRVGTFKSPRESAQLLDKCDVVVDFSAHSGEVADIKAHYLNNVRGALEFSRPAARYVFISTINAFGMNARFNRAKHYSVPHSIYAYTKRYGERLALRLGRQFRKEAFVFRLGHVHGFLQRVSSETIELVRGKNRRFEYPSTPSYTIFCHSVAEAIVSVAEGRERPGIYTLISEPPWSWKELLEHYADRDRNITVTLSRTHRRNLSERVAVGIKTWLLRGVYGYKDTLNANLLHCIPSLERKCRAYFYSLRARQQISEFQALQVYRPFGIHIGIFPGKRLPGVSDSRLTMSAKAIQVKKMLGTVANDDSHSLWIRRNM